MILIKEYKGVKIYVSTDGEFYCNPSTNSNELKNKTFGSTKLPSIEKAIDEFTGTPIENGNTYYDIPFYYYNPKPLKVVKQIGTRLFFDDGTDSSMSSRKSLYPKSIDETKDFQKIKELSEEIDSIQKEINALTDKQHQLRTEADKKLKNLFKVIVK